MEIARNKDFIFNVFGKDDRVFIRPDDNMKTFVGNVVAREQFDSWYNHCKDYEAYVTCLCVVSRPEVIKKEWRVIIKEDTIVTGSQYLEHGCLTPEEGFPDEVGIKVSEIVKSSLWQPEPIYAMDIALVEDEYRLMEIGSINAGFYKSDLRKIAKAVTEVVKELY